MSKKQILNVFSVFCFLTVISLSFISDGDVEHNNIKIVSPKGYSETKPKKENYSIITSRPFYADNQSTTNQTPKHHEVSNVLITANNPAPEKLPTLTVWEDEELSPGKKLTMVSASFPNVPGFVCDAWCYESDFEFMEAHHLPQGGLQLQHRWSKYPFVLIITEVKPEPGAVEFLAHLELIDKTQEFPPEMPFVNLCWQVRHAPNFASKPDPYPEFIKRCFIFTSKGRTFLNETKRNKIPVRSDDDPYNNPPWVQMYVTAQKPLPQTPPNSWAGYSPDQFIVPIIGVISRDGKYLSALANDSAPMMAQAWHDCLHNNPEWSPPDAPPLQRKWRLKVYAMPNDSDALLQQVQKDFPSLKINITP